MTLWLPGIKVWISPMINKLFVLKETIKTSRALVTKEKLMGFQLIQ